MHTIDGLGIADDLPFPWLTGRNRIGIRDFKPIVLSITARNLSSLHLKQFGK